MRFHNILSSISASHSQARVLETLLYLPARTWTGRQLALETKVSQARVNLALKKLREYGIVYSQRAGAAVLWSVNPRHLLVNSLKPVASMENYLQSYLVKEFKSNNLGLCEIDKIILFGSVARGDEKPSSDIDLLVIVKNASSKEKVLKELLDNSADLIGAFGGNALAPIVYSKEEAGQKSNSPFMQEIRKQGITIYDGALA
ncbi:MAG: nucleotidyltransferase domain-containing protein [Candidatus Micrarchaeota archaeon]